MNKDQLLQAINYKTNKDSKAHKNMSELDNIWNENQDSIQQPIFMCSNLKKGPRGKNLNFPLKLTFHHKSDEFFT